MAYGLPLEWLLGVVVVGVPLVTVLAGLTAGSDATLDAGTLRPLVAVEVPGAEVQAVLPADDGTLALVDLVDGRVCVAWVMEHHIGVRLLGPSAVQEISGGLLLRLGDAGWPDRIVRIADPAARAAWRARVVEGRHVA